MSGQGEGGGPRPPPSPAPVEPPTPLASASETLARVRALGVTSVIVGLSGGKDSIGCLDLCFATFPRVEAYHMYLVPGLRFAEAPVEACERRFGIRVHRLPHWELSRFLRGATCMMHSYRAVTCPKVTVADVEAEVRARTGIDWLVYGHRRDESLQRCGMLSACDGVYAKGRRAYPLARWHGRDVLGYLQARGLPLPALCHGHQASGVGLGPRFPIWMRERHPADWARFLAAFPFAEARIRAYELQRADKRAARAVYGSGRP